MALQTNPQQIEPMEFEPYCRALSVKTRYCLTVRTHFTDHIVV